MAETGEFERDFVNPPVVDLQCQLCHNMLHDAVITDCCGHFCQACIEPFINDAKPCPVCGFAGKIVTVRDRKLRRKILRLDVYCPMRSRGCQWVGELDKRREHLEAEDGCPFFDLSCRNSCSARIQRRKMTEHLDSHCPERAFLCDHCGFEDTYKVVSEQHWPECALFPLRCPNKCGVAPVERRAFDKHLQTCPLQEIECEFSFAGCAVKLPRKDFPQHLEDKDSIQAHLQLVLRTNIRQQDSALKQKDAVVAEMRKERDRQAGEISRLDAEMKAVLQVKEEQVSDIQEALCNKDVEISRLDAEMKAALQVKEEQVSDIQEALCSKDVEIATLHNALDSLKETVSKLAMSVQWLTSLQQKLQVMYSVSHYLEVKAEYWYSPPFFSHSEGYRLQLQVVVNSAEEGSTSVYLGVMQGMFDAVLNWPLNAEVTVQLIDVLNHHVPHEKSQVGSARMHRDTQISRLICRWDRFISHSQIDRYIFNDSLHFRVVLRILE